MMSATFYQVQAPFPWAGETASLVAALIWACSLSAYRKFGNDVAPHALNLFKNTIALVFLTIIAFAMQPSVAIDWQDGAMLAASGLIGLAIGDTFFFAALKRLGAQVTSATQCLGPPLTALIATAFLGERLDGWETLGMSVAVVGVTGVIIFNNANRANSRKITAKSVGIGFSCALMSAASQAVAIVMQRQALQRVDIFLGTVLRLAPAVLVLFVMSYFVGFGANGKNGILGGGRRRFVALFTAAFFGAFFGTVLMSSAAKFAKAGVAAVLSASYPLWIIPIAYFALGERTGWKSIACTVLAVFGLVLMFFGK